MGKLQTSLTSVQVMETWLLLPRKSDGLGTIGGNSNCVPCLSSSVVDEWKGRGLIDMVCEKTHKRALPNTSSTLIVDPFILASFTHIQ